MMKKTALRKKTSAASRKDRVRGPRPDKESFYKAVFNSLNDHLAVLDHEGTIVAVNEGWRRFAEDNRGGGPPEVYIGANYLEVCRRASDDVSVDARRALDGIEKVITGERPGFEMEYPCHSPREQRWFFMRVTPLHEGKTGVVVSHSDITIRKQTQEALRASEEKFSKAFNLSPDAILITRLEDGAVFDVNQAFLEKMGYRREEVIGKSAAELRNWAIPGDRDKFVKALKLNGECRAMETVFRSKEGRLVPSLISARLMDVEREPRVLSITTDITRLKEVEEAAGRSREALENRVAERTAQLSGLSDALLKEIDARRKTESELRLFKSIFESSSEAIAVSDLQGRLVYINPAHEKLFGRSLQETRQLNCREYYPPESIAKLEEEVTPALARGESWEGEMEVYDANGHRLTLWERADTVRDRDGKLLYGFGFMQEVTDRTKAEELLKQRTRELTERIKELNCLHNISSLVSERGMTVGKILQGVVNIIPPAFLHPQDTSARIMVHGQEFRSPKFRRSPHKLSGTIVVYGKEVGMLEVHCVKSIPKGAPVPFLEEETLLVGSIAERVGRILEREQARENIYILTQELIHAQENERQMISSELHDRVAQDLSAAKISCYMLRRHVSETAAEGIQLLDQLGRTLDRTVMAVRDLSYEMRPPGLDEMGVSEVLDNLCREFTEKTGIAVDYQSVGMSKLRNDTLIGISFYRLVQEALNNIRKYARATRVSVRLVCSHPHAVLRIEDNGVGFDVEQAVVTAAEEKRMGLFSMQQRARLLKGKMKIRSIIGKGTKLTLKIPIVEVTYVD